MTYEVLERINNALLGGDAGGALSMIQAALKEGIIHKDTSTEEYGEEDVLTELALDDVKHWVEAAICHLKACGRNVALAEFSNPVGRFVKNGMYIFALDTTGQMIAHGANDNYIGQDFYHVNDFDGRPFIRHIVDTANSQGYGWVEYKWLNPRTGRAEPKVVYFERNDGVIVCCGLYLPE